MRYLAAVMAAAFMFFLGAVVGYARSEYLWTRATDPSWRDEDDL